MEQDGAPRTPRDDLQRIRDYLAGDASVFMELEGWIRTVLRACYPSLREEIEDLCQSVHQKLVVNLQGDRFHHRSSLRTYVQSVAHYTCIDRLRRRFRDLPLEPAALERAEETAPNPYQALEEKERTRLFQRVLHLSPEMCRNLWRMTFHEKLSYEAIGSRLGIPSGTVKSRMWHCRKKAMIILRQLGWRAPHPAGS
jgi:RNA polymerase sigma-70 factor (ECF subfamily)